MLLVHFFLFVQFPEGKPVLLAGAPRGELFSFGGFVWLKGMCRVFNATIQCPLNTLFSAEEERVRTLHAADEKTKTLAYRQRHADLRHVEQKIPEHTEMTDMEVHVDRARVFILQISV